MRIDGCNMTRWAVTDLNHGGVGACSHTLNFAKGEESIRSGLAFLDVKVVLDGLLDLFRATDHARRGAAQLDEVLSDLRAVEHGVERSNFIDTNGGHVQDLSDLVHSCKRQPAAILSLRQVQQRDCGSLFVVLGVSANDVRDLYEDEEGNYRPFS